MPCKAHELKIEQGIIDEIKIIIYDGNNFSIYDQTNDNSIHNFIEECNWDNCSLSIDTIENFTHEYNGVMYSYFFIYIKSGDGTERIDLAYTGIDIENKIVSEPMIADKFTIIQLNNTYKDDLAYYEMLDVYKDLQDKFSELLKTDTDI